MDINHDARRTALVEQAVASLAQYQKFVADYRITFSLSGRAADGSLRILGKLERSDRLPFPAQQPPHTLQEKLACLKDQTVVFRPLFSPAFANPPDEHPWNDFARADFDFALILPYVIDGEGQPKLTSMFYLPTDLLLQDNPPGEDGITRPSGLSTYFVHQLGLDPQHKASRILFLADRMTEELAYRYDQGGFFYSNPL